MEKSKEQSPNPLSVEEKIFKANAKAKTIADKKFPWEDLPNPLRKTIDLEGGEITVDSEGYPVTSPPPNNPFERELPPLYVTGKVTQVEAEEVFDFETQSLSDQRVAAHPMGTENWFVEDKSEDVLAEEEFLRNVFLEMKKQCEAEGVDFEEDPDVKALRANGGSHLLPKGD